MGAVLLFFTIFTPPEDSIVYHGVDMISRSFSRYWDDAYDTSISAFRTSQGSYDMFYWFQHHEGKVELPCIGFFSLRYLYYADFTLDHSVEWHRLEPTFRIAPGFYTHIVISPFYKKRYDELGVGASYRPSNRNWIYLYGIMQGFDHNNSMRHIRSGPNKDPYSFLPFRFELDARGELPWLRARAHAEIGTHSVQYLDWPDSTIYVWQRDADKSTAWGRLEFSPVKDLWAGTRISYSLDRSQTLWAEKDSVIADTVLDIWLEPYVSWSPTERLELLCQHRIWRYYHGMDSLNYQRDFNVFSATASWKPLDFLVLEAAFQRQWRYRYIDGDSIAEVWNMPHGINRILFNAEFRFKSGVMFTVKEGIKADQLFKTFQRFHAHADVQIYIPLAFISDLGKKATSDSLTLH